MSHFYTNVTVAQLAPVLAILAGRDMPNPIPADNDPATVYEASYGFDHMTNNYFFDVMIDPNSYWPEIDFFYGSGGIAKTGVSRGEMLEVLSAAGLEDAVWALAMDMPY